MSLTSPIYHERADGRINVRLGGRLVGVICPSKGGGFHYRPKDGGWGETLPTIAEVKRSLAGEQ